MRKAALHNLGCKVNAYETEAMQQMLEQAGYEIVPFDEKADVYVVNTCSVTNMADRKSRQMLHRAKKNNPDSVVVAAGCYVQTSPEQAQADKAVDILIGNNKKHELPEMLERFFAGREAGNPVLPGEGRPLFPAGAAAGTERMAGGPMQQEEPLAAGKQGSGCRSIGDIAQEREYEKLRIGRTAEHTRAFIKVQDGCNQFCSYCIIPYARGRVRSRSPEDVVQEVKRLAANGYREVVLTGIHLSSYGMGLENKDAIGKSPQEEVSLLDLIRKVHGVQGIERIRLGSLEPQIITEGFVQELSKMFKVCPHFHLSLQSGCDATLSRMNRKYTCQEYEERCRLLREYFHHPAITTDVIVGFPGETEEEFEATRRFLKKIGFFEMHIFKYSVREGTRAAKMPDQVPEGIKNRRSEALFADAAPMNRHYLEWHLGREVEALMEEKVLIEGQEYFLGHTKEYVKVALPLEGRQEQGLGNQIVKAKAASLLKGNILSI